jgi:uncharacterized membrane protein YfcA
MQIPITDTFLLFASYVTHALTAVVGIGGGKALLAVMTALLPAPVVVPIHGVVQLTSNTTRTLLFLRHVHWTIFAYYAIPAIAGVFLGARFYVDSPLPWFRPAVGVFILVYLVTMRHEPRLRRLPLATFALLGLVVGLLAAVLGATGPAIAPFFLRDDLDKEQVIATKAAVQITTHLAKLPAFFMMGFDYRAHAGLIVPLLVAAVAGTFVGKHYLAGLSGPAFRKLFVAVLATIALYLIFGDWLG